MVCTEYIRVPLNTKPRHVSHVNSGINSNYRYLSHNAATFDYRTRWSVLGQTLVDLPPIKHLAQMTIENPSPYGYIVKTNTALTETALSGQPSMITPESESRAIPVLNQRLEAEAYALPETLSTSKLNAGALVYRRPAQSNASIWAQTKGPRPFVANRSSGYYNPVSYTNEMNMGNHNIVAMERDPFQNLGDPKSIKQMEKDAVDSNKLFDIAPAPTGMPGANNVV